MPFLEAWLNVDCAVTFEEVGLKEDGSPETSVTWLGRAKFVEQSKTVIDSQRREVLSVGNITVKGDVAPTVKLISSGSVTIDETTYAIVSASRPRNFDGSVYYTKLVLA